ncbi:MAG: XRE family transcriptional regulator [Oligoflexia bacterium]|nr:XRE family transcriptional regulator [Oligoflexia bacterium]
MKTKSKKNYVTAKNPTELAKALGIDSPADIALMEYKAQLSAFAEKVIAASGLTVNEIVKLSGIARSKVSAIKNGALAGISSDLFLKVIAAAGGKVTFKLAS